MSTQTLRVSIDTLLTQCLSHRISQITWLSLLHQLLERSAGTDSQDIGPDGQAKGILISDVLLDRLFAQTIADPLLVQYLQTVIYGSPSRNELEPDQGPLADVVTVALCFVSQADRRGRDIDDWWTQQMPTMEAVSTCVGQGLIVHLQASVSFQVDNTDFFALLRKRFPGPSKPAQTEDAAASLLGSTLAFVKANVHLMALAAHPTSTSALALLSPRVGSTLLVNIGQALLVHVYGRLITTKLSKDTVADLLQQADQVTAHIESVLKTTNAARTNEIALLRNLTSQISLIAEVCKTQSHQSTSVSGKQLRQAGDIVAATQTRASWDYFLNVDSIKLNNDATSLNAVEPEIIVLFDVLVDRHVAWSAKLESVKICFLARRALAAPSVTLEKTLISYYYELLAAAIETCAIVLKSPPPSDAGIYAAVWRSSLCGILPEVILQFEVWLDANPDLPLRGQLQDAPHVRVEEALKAVFVVKSDELEVCETAAAPRAAVLQAGVDMMIDIAGSGAQASQPIRAWLLRAFIEHSLARPEAITDEFPGGNKLASEIQNLPQSLGMDAQLEGLSLSALFEARFSSEDPIELLRRVASDPGTLFAFARELSSQMRSWIDMRDLEGTARWCRILSDDLTFLDTLMLFIDPTQLVSPLATILDNQDVNEASDEPSTLSAILLFLQLVCYRYDIPPERIESPSEGATPFLSTYVSSSSVCDMLSDLTPEDKDLVGRWIQALFGNEGISDDLIQASLPRTLLRLAPLLFSQSITACIYGVIDLETLRGGLSYFLQDLLSFALPGAMRWLLTDVMRTPLIPILDLLAGAGLEGSLEAPSTDGMLANGLSRKANSRTVYLEVMTVLLDTDSCPSIVRHLTAKYFDRFVASSGLQRTMEGAESFNLTSIKARMTSYGHTTRDVRNATSWRPILLNHARAEAQLLLHPIFYAGTTVMQEIDQAGVGQVAAAIETQLLDSDTDSNLAAKYLAAWCTLPTLAQGQRQPLLALISHFNYALVPATASVVPLVHFLTLVLGLLHATDTLKTSDMAAEDTSAGLFDDEDQQLSSAVSAPSVTAEDATSLICLKLTRLRSSHAAVWQSYVDAFKAQQDCIAPTTRAQMWSWFGLQEF